MADPNPTRFNQLEEKKWIISRIDLFHQTMITLFDNDLKKYESLSDKAIAETRNKRNIILTVVGLVLTVFLGYNGSYPVGELGFFTIIAVLGIIGFIVVLFFSFAIKFVEDFFSIFTNIITDIIGKIAISHGYFVTRPVDLMNLSFNFVRNYYFFILLLNSATRITTAKSLRELSKKYSRIKGVQEALLDEAKGYEKGSEFIPTYFSRFDRTQDVPPELLQFVDDSLAHYKPKDKSNN